MYHRFIENNNTSEGEVWNAFIKSPQTEEEKKLFESFERLLSMSDNDNEEDSYYLESVDGFDYNLYNQKEVDSLLKENDLSKNSYMSEYIIAEISQDVLKVSKRIKDGTPWYEVQDELYKMKLLKKISTD